MSEGETDRTSKISKRTVFLGGIPIDSTKNEVLAYLEQFDCVQKLDIPKDKSTKILKGYAKAVLKTSEGVDRLLAQPFHFLKKLQVSVKRWTNKKDYLRQKDKVSRRKLFVRFHPIYDCEGLLEHFSCFGTIENLDTKTDPLTNLDRFIAYVTFSTEEEAAKAAKYGIITDRERYIYCEITTPSYIMTLENKTSLCGSPTLKGNAKTTKKGTFPSFEPLDDPRVGSFASDNFPMKHNMQKEIKSASQVKKKAQKPTKNEIRQYFGSLTALSKKENQAARKSDPPREKLSSAPIAEEFFQFHDTKPTSKLYVYPTTNNQQSKANVVFRKLVRRYSIN